MDCRAFGVIALFSMALAVAPARAQTQQQLDECADKAGGVSAESRISACTAVILSGNPRAKNLEWAYAGRCAAHMAKHDLDQTIVDCSDAIGIDPNDATSFLNRGRAYQAKSSYEKAIADYDRAIAIDLKLMPAYGWRAMAHQAQGDYDKAVADYDQVILLAPENPIAHSGRGRTYYMKGDYEKAIANYNEAIRLDPKNANTYFNRARAYQAQSEYDKSMADLDQANRLAPNRPYVALMLEIMTRRNNLPSRLQALSSQLDMTKWPAPVIRMFLGQTTAADVMAAADDADPATKRKQICEAVFFSGEFALQTAAKDEGLRLLKRAAAECSKFPVVHEVASSELKILEKNQ